MDTLITVSMGLLPLGMISLVFGSSTYSSMPGAKVDLSILEENELLIPSCDRKKDAMLQEKHNEASRFVALANFSYRTRADLQATSQALLQAVECYEAIREQAESAVVELNLAILARARLKVELEKGASKQFIETLQAYCKNAHERADWFLKHETKRYDPEVRARYDKLKVSQCQRMIQH